MGRARQFDEAVLLDAAIELFWVNGYRSASLGDLSAVTGVGNGSLYQAYGSKWELFVAAFRVYCARRVDLVEATLAGPHDDAEQTLTDYFEGIIADCAAYPDRRGCLLVNSISELGTTAEVGAIASAAIARMEAAVQRALAEAVDASKADLDTPAAQAVALSQALIQLSRLGRDSDDLRRIGRRTASQIGRGLQAA